MPNDEKVKEEILEATLSHLRDVLAGNKTEDPILKLLGISVSLKDNEDKQNVALADDDGESTIIKVREDGEVYKIPDFNEAWASDEWWKMNAFVSPVDVLFSVAYYYAKEQGASINNIFADRDEARDSLCKTLKPIKKKD